MSSTTLVSSPRRCADPFEAAGLYFAAATGLGAVTCALRRPDTRRALADVGLAFAAVALLYAPWMPTLVRQINATGAPWSEVPVLREAVSALGSVLGDERVLVVALLVAAVVPLAALARRAHTGEGGRCSPSRWWWPPPWAWPGRGHRSSPGGRPATSGSSWPPCSCSPLWGSAGLVAPGSSPSASSWCSGPNLWGASPGARVSPTMDDKSNVEQVARRLEPLVRPGDLVISTQLEHVPLLHHELGADVLRHPSGSGR